jgi:hypothetical protein
MLTKLAVRWLTYQLRKDAHFYFCYQSNIAMAIYDNCRKYLPLTTKKKSPTLLEFCNICAKDFMDMWIKKR